MPPFLSWLRSSWDDFLRRWARIFAAAGTTGAAALIAGLLPFALAAAAALLGVGRAWIVWGTAGLGSLLAVVWLSSWSQAAMMRAARFEESFGDCLAISWSRTAGLAWVITLVLVAVAGGLFLFLLPGLILSVLLFATPFYQISGEAEGLRALALSWARVKPRFFDVALRIMALALITSLAGRIPYVGWIAALVLAPFGVVALSRLAEDLRAAAPEALPAPRGGVVAVLALIFVLGTGAAVWSLARLARSFSASGGFSALADGLDADTGRALVAVLSGEASPEQAQKALRFALAQDPRPRVWRVESSTRVTVTETLFP